MFRSVSCIYKIIFHGGPLDIWLNIVEFLKNIFFESDSDYVQKRMTSKCHASHVDWITPFCVHKNTLKSVYLLRIRTWRYEAVMYFCSLADKHSYYFEQLPESVALSTLIVSVVGPLSIPDISWSVFGGCSVALSEVSSSAPAEFNFEACLQSKSLNVYDHENNELRGAITIGITSPWCRANRLH